MKNSKVIPQYGDRFWHKKYNEYCYYVRTMPDGNYLCGLNPRLRDDDDYYSYKPNNLIKK